MRISDRNIWYVSQSKSSIRMTRNVYLKKIGQKWGSITHWWLPVVHRAKCKLASAHPTTSFCFADNFSKDLSFIYVLLYLVHLNHFTYALCLIFLVGPPRCVPHVQNKPPSPYQRFCSRLHTLVRAHGSICGFLKTLSWVQAQILDQEPINCHTCS